MDLTTFSKDTFDPKEWINDTFQCPEAKDNKEEFAATIVAKLQSFIQEVNVSLEKTAEKVNHNMPRIAREIEVMQSEAKLLQQQMSSLKGDVMKVEHDSSQTMQNLLKIDHIKSSMQEASKALREADNWTTLSSNVEEIFESGDVTAIAAKLVSMQNSLEILVDVTDYHDRCIRLETLKDRLEAILCPKLITAFNTQSVVTDFGLIYMKIFKDIKRLQTLQKHYHNFHKKALLQQWTQVIEADLDESLIDWLNNFHDILLSTWHSQITCCQQLLPNIPAVEVLSELLVDVLTNLDPPLSFCIDAGMKLQSNQLHYIIELKQITDRLAKSLEISILSLDSKFLAIPHVILLVKTIYTPFRSYIQEYANLEKQKLINDLKIINMQSLEVEDNVQQLGNSLSKIFNFVQEAENRCLQLTNGCGYPSLFCALEDFFEEYSGNFRCVLRSLNTKIIKDGANSADNWLAFQKALQTTQIIGEVLMNLENLDILFMRNIQKVGRKLGYFSSPSEITPLNPFQAYDEILLSNSAKKDFQQIIIKIQEDKTASPLKDVILLFKKLCADSGTIVCDSILQQAKVHLKDLPLMSVWHDEPNSSVLTDLPIYSLSPQSCITEVGQYLMTIPQHVQPFIMRDNPALYTALKYCRFQNNIEQDSSSNVADFLLECLAQGITEFYRDSILKIPFLTNYATNQLITDISYFCDILDDLGLTPSLDLQYILCLLKSKPDEFESVSQGKPHLLIEKIAKMRNLLTSTS